MIDTFEDVFNPESMQANPLLRQTYSAGQMHGWSKEKMMAVVIVSLLASQLLYQDELRNCLESRMPSLVIDASKCDPEFLDKLKSALS